MASYDLDVESVPASDFPKFAPIPSGEYLLQVVASEIKDTRNGTGKYIKFTFEVLDGKYAGRMVFDNVNVKNQSEETERIAQRSLADLCLALGIGHLRDTEELHFRPFKASVSIQADITGKYGPQNRLKYYTAKAVGAAAPAQQTARPLPPRSATPQPRQPTPPPANGVPRNKPWQKKPEVVEEDPPF